MSETGAAAPAADQQTQSSAADLNKKAEEVALNILPAVTKAAVTIQSNSTDTTDNGAGGDGANLEAAQQSEVKDGDAEKPEATGAGQSEVKDGDAAEVKDGDTTNLEGGRRRTKRKQQKKGKSAKKGGKKHRKSSGKKSRRSSSKKSRRQGRK